MTREEKITAIYKEMANKELTPGCYVRIEPPYNEYGTFLYRLRGDESKEGIKEIIGHPVMIGDVLDYFKDKRFYCGKCKRKVDKKEEPDHNCGKDYYYYIFDEDSPGLIRDRILSHWENEGTPIEDQSDECIDYVYSLIQKD